MTSTTSARHSEVMDEERNTHDVRDRDALIEEVARRACVRAERGRRFAELTSLRVGGASDWLLAPETEQAAAVVGALEDEGIAWRVLGAGSNVLADDREHRYVVVSTREVKGGARFEGERVSVSAGFSLPRLCVEVARRGLSGIEGLGGIPGTVGGALWMNAGAYGHEIGQVVESVRVARGGKVVEVRGDEVKWNYRHTSFKEGELLLGCTLRLKTDDPEAIKARMDEAKQKRFATQPHGARSAGCFFKNPPGSGMSTGRMIARSSRPYMRTSSSPKGRRRAPRTRSPSPKRYANASVASTGLSSNTKSSSGARTRSLRMKAAR